MWIGSDQFLPVLGNNPSTGGASNSTTETCYHMNMGKYQSMMAVITLGTNTVTTSNLYVMEASTSSTAGLATGKYSYRTASTLGSATLSARAAGASTAVVLASTAETLYVVEVKSDDLSAGYPFCYVSISSAAATRNATVVYVLKPRYEQNSMAEPNT